MRGGNEIIATVIMLVCDNDVIHKVIELDYSRDIKAKAI